MYIVLVPVFGIFLKKKDRAESMGGSGTCAAGALFLCITKGDFQLQKRGYLYTGLAAVFAIHILVVDYFRAGGRREALLRADAHQCSARGSADAPF